MRKYGASSIPLAAAAVVAASLVTMAAGYAAPRGTSVKPYAVSLDPAYDIVPLFSAADTVPVTGNSSLTYQMCGIPDGLGARLNAAGNIIVFMNHEFTNANQSLPILGKPLNRGAIVSRLIVDPSGNVLTADRAYQKVYLDDTLVGPAADTTNTTPAFGRFCSGHLGTPADGLTTNIYFTNEETTGSASFDGRGGLAVAIFENEAHGLTAFGRFAWENTVIQPRPGDNRVVFLCMEDGAVNQDPLQDNSQLYMYVGTKSTAPGATTLEKNGLVGGTLYVFRALDRSKNSELAFQSGTIEGEWVAIPGVDAMTDVQLEAATDAANAMLFVRPEDGAFNPRNRNNYFFVTTGGLKGANELGRLYSLRLNPANPTGHASLSVVYNADSVIAGGGDIAISPDNVDVSQDYVMVCEDGTAQSRLVMAAKNRDGSIWRFDLTGFAGCDPATAKRVVELDPPGRDNLAVGPGIWETSGIIDGTGLFGDGYFLFDVQAHSPTTAPGTSTVEDGQLLLLRKL